MRVLINNSMVYVFLQEAVLCPDPGKEYPGAGSGENEREILPFRVFLSAAGCLLPKRWNDPTFAATLKKLTTMCGSLELNDVDKVHEAMILLMMAKQGFSRTIKAVQRDLARRCEGHSGGKNLEMFYTAMNFVKGWSPQTTDQHLERGRALFREADLWPEEVLGARLYTGPQFMHYNASLRNDPLDTMCGNRYVTTIHCINSAIIKLARASPIEPLIVYRGLCGMRLPVQFAAKDKSGRQGNVEFSFMSCTSDRNVALQYAAGGKMAVLLCLERSGMNNGGPLSALSFYKDEEEICFPPLCSIEVKDKPKIVFTDKGSVLQVKMGITVNQKADTIDKLIGRRKFLHEGTVFNLVQEVESELKSVEALLSTIRGLFVTAHAQAQHHHQPLSRTYSQILAPSIEGSAPEQALIAFVEKARQTCKDTLAALRNKPEVEFNDDDTYSTLVKEASDMKSNEAIKGGRPYQLLAAWFTYCAKADGRILEEVVRRLDTHLWSEEQVVCTDVLVTDKDGRTLLLAACGAGRMKMYEALIKAGADVSVADKDGRTPLLAACRAGSFEICKALIKAGADVSAADRDRMTPLLEACRAGKVEICEALIKAGADVSAADKDGRTPLLEACRGERVEMCKALIKAGADVSAADKGGMMPLLEACGAGSIEICDLLIKAGADVSAARCSPLLHTPASFTSQPSLGRIQNRVAAILPSPSPWGHNHVSEVASSRIPTHSEMLQLAQALKEAREAVMAIPIAIRESIAAKHADWGEMNWSEKLQLLNAKQGPCGPSGCGDGAQCEDGAQGGS